ncbi:unnamed protein product [Pedinophyceae sp. YPF-701]|nr:unnamed protein product [Pedinophyceae sp. YPF-701]
MSRRAAPAPDVAEDAGDLPERRRSARVAVRHERAAPTPETGTRGAEDASRGRNGTPKRPRCAAHRFWSSAAVDGAGVRSCTNESRAKRAHPDNPGDLVPLCTSCARLADAGQRRPPRYTAVKVSEERVARAVTRCWATFEDDPVLSQLQASDAQSRAHMHEVLLAAIVDPETGEHVLGADATRLVERRLAALNDELAASNGSAADAEVGASAPARRRRRRGHGWARVRKRARLGSPRVQQPLHAAATPQPDDEEAAQPDDDEAALAGAVQQYTARLQACLSYYSKVEGLRPGHLPLRHDFDVALLREEWRARLAAPQTGQGGLHARDVEVHSIGGCRAPLVVLQELRESKVSSKRARRQQPRLLVEKHFKPRLIRDLRKVQATRTDASGEHRFLEAFGSFHPRDGADAIEQIVESNLELARRDPGRTPAEVPKLAFAESVMKRFHKAMQGLLKDIKEAVISPYVDLLRVDGYMQAHQPNDGFVLDYHAGSDADDGAGLGVHVDGGLWTLVFVLPTLPGQEWEGCELVFDCGSTAPAPEPGDRVRRISRGSLGRGPLKSNTGLCIRPVEPKEDKLAEEFWAAALKPGDVVCQSAGFVHAVTDLRSVNASEPGRRQSIALFMGMPIGRADLARRRRV